MKHILLTILLFSISCAYETYSPRNPSSELTLIQTSSEKAIELIKSLKLKERKKIITFIGYSGKEYQDNKKMLKLAQEKLSNYSNQQYIVNIGITYSGIGQVYTIAKSLGFKTIGIASDKAMEYLEKVKDVDTAYMISDNNVYDYDYRKWGGYQTKQEVKLVPVSKAIVSVSDSIIAFGGGDVAYAELKESAKNSIEIDFQCMMIKKEKALKKALNKAKKKAQEKNEPYEKYYKKPKFYGKSCNLKL